MTLAKILRRGKVWRGVSLMMMIILVMVVIATVDGQCRLTEVGVQILPEERPSVQVVCCIA